MVAITKLCVRVMVPKIMPLPVLVVVMVMVFAPVSSVPKVISNVGTETLLLSVMVFTDAVLFIVKILKVVAPVMVLFDAPLNCTVLVPAVNVPLLIQSPYT